MCHECKLRAELRKSGISDDVTVYELAEYLNLSARRVYALARDGIISQSSRGRYNLISSIEGYISYLKNEVIARRVEHRYE